MFADRRLYLEKDIRFADRQGALYVWEQHNFVIRLIFVSSIFVVCSRSFLRRRVSLVFQAKSSAVVSFSSEISEFSSPVVSFVFGYLLNLLIDNHFGKISALTVFECGFVGRGSVR